MARKLIRENYRVEVIPEEVRGVIYLTRNPPSEEEKLRRRCDEIAAAIRRHIDDVASVSTTFDSKPVCEHCGYVWAEESTTYNGGCCDEDEAANPEAEAANG